MMPESPDNSSISMNLTTTTTTTASSSDLTRTSTLEPVTRDMKGSLPSIQLNDTGSRSDRNRSTSNGNGGNSSDESPSPPSHQSATSSSALRGCGGSIMNGTATATTTTTTITTSSSVTSASDNGRSRLVDPQAAVCGSRQLSKVKRFLTTLQQFGSDISTEAGDRVRNLILSLVNGTLAIDEFHMKLQETTNFPLRPFVIPFLKANLPLLQREILHYARVAKLPPQQYLHQHENMLLDSSHSTSNEPLEIFHHMSELNENGKRRLPDVNNRLKENGNSAAADQLLDLHGPPPKRHHQHHHSLLSPPLGLHQSSPSSLGLHSNLPLRLDDFALARELRERDQLCLDRDYRHFVYSPRDILDERETEEEWKNIHTMLNCILGMVEKTKRALAILQHRSQTDRQELAMWIRRHTEGTENNLKKYAGDMMAQTLKTTEDRVSEVKRRAEEAVNDVKRQAVVELQKAVSAAETKAKELVASERGKIEKMIVEARRQATDEATVALNQQADSNETCWNCGRKANETCSGCNIARYCGAFCQHKDWENHHHVCGQGSQTSSSVTSSSGVVTKASSTSSVQLTNGPSSSICASDRGGATAATSSATTSIKSGGGATMSTAVTVHVPPVKIVNAAVANLSRSGVTKSSTPIDHKCCDGSKH